ncbi:BON domain-containing protein [Orrella sp. JC864]|uniref:BON domain-containing protein n=1 Tax=Orrella sp. JC864 TaxID=3120298 RepID=UPI0012BC4609
MSTLKKTPAEKDRDAQRKETEGPGSFPQEFEETGDVQDLQHGGYQRGEQGGYQGSYDEAKFEQHPLAEYKKKSDDAPKAGDARLIEDVRAQLAENGPYLDAHDLSVDVRNGVATLRGQVRKESTRQDIEAAVGCCAGLTGIDNRIVVAGT